MSQALQRANVAANKVRQKRANHDGTFLIVEGEDDSLFFGKHIDESRCSFVIANGWEAVTGAIEILEAEKFPGVIGIVDSDFSRITNKPRQGSNVCVTDTHDLETMLFFSSAFEDLLREYCDPARAAQYIATAGKRDIRDALTDIAVSIGQIRLVSELDELALDFQGLKFEKFINIRDMTFHRTLFLNELQQRWGRGVLDRDAIEQSVNVLPPTYDLKQLVNGGDIIELISLGLQRAFGARNDSEIFPERLRKAMRLAYPKESFKGSQLFMQLSAWEGRNPEYRFLL